MKQRAITSVYIVLASVLAVLSKLIPVVGDYIFDVFILGVTIVAAFEICNILEANKRKINRIMASFYCVVNYIILLIFVNKVNFGVLLLIEAVALIVYWVISFIVEYVNDSKSPVKQNFVSSLNTLLACVYPSFMFCLLININHANIVEYFSIVIIMMIVLITWLTDTFAYLVGRTFKGPKLAPKISPNKTISGAIGGLLGGIAGAMLIYLLVYLVPAMSGILNHLSWWQFLLIGVFGSMFGQMGDLFESKLKRNAGIKDSGNIFPGHGGMLDRIDAMIFVSTFVYIVIFSIFCSI